MQGGKIRQPPWKRNKRAGHHPLWFFWHVTSLCLRDEWTWCHFDRGRERKWSHSSPAGSRKDMRIEARWSWRRGSVGVSPARLWTDGRQTAGQYVMPSGGLQGMTTLPSAPQKVFTTKGGFSLGQNAENDTLAVLLSISARVSQLRAANFKSQPVIFIKSGNCHLKVNWTVGATFSGILNLLFAFE